MKERGALDYSPEQRQNLSQLATLNEGLLNLHLAIESQGYSAPAEVLQEIGKLTDDVKQVQEDIRNINLFPNEQMIGSLIQRFQSIEKLIEEAK